MAWFTENCTGFAKEYGLVPALLGDMELTGPQRTLFMSKLNAIHGLMVRMQQAEMEKESRRR